MLPLFVSVALAAKAPALPPDAQAWVDRLRTAYAHYEKVRFTFTPQVRTGLACPSAEQGTPLSLMSNPDTSLVAAFQADPRGFVAACEAARTDGWELWADLDPVDRRVFNVLRVRVSPLPAGGDGTNLLSGAVSHGATASKGVHVAVPSGGYLVEEVGNCAVGAMFVYEAHDLVVALADASAEHVAWSPCGAMHFEMKSIAWLAEEADKEREFWGMQFPAARQTGRMSGGAAELPD